MDVTSVSHAVENAIRAGTQHQDKPTYMWLNPSQPNGYANASMIVQCGDRHTEHLFMPSSGFDMNKDKEILRRQYRFRREAIYLDNELISQRSWHDYYDEVMHMHRNYWVGVKYHRRPANNSHFASVVFVDGTQRKADWRALTFPTMSVYWFDKPLFSETRVKRQEFDVELTVLTDRMPPRNTLNDHTAVPLPYSTREMLVPHADTLLANYFRNLLAQDDKMVTSCLIEGVRSEKFKEYERFVDPVRENREDLYREFKTRGYEEIVRSYPYASVDLWFVKKGHDRTLVFPTYQLYDIPRIAERIYEDHDLVIADAANDNSSHVQNNNVLEVRSIFLDGENVLSNEAQTGRQWSSAAESIEVYFDDRSDVPRMIHMRNNLSSEFDWLAYTPWTMTPRLLVHRDFDESDLLQVRATMDKQNNIGNAGSVNALLASNDHTNELLFQHDLKRALMSYGWTSADITRAVKSGVRRVELGGWEVAGHNVTWRKATE